MAARTESKVSPKYKTKYRVKNWPAYDVALRDRGGITIWFDEESICAWNAPPSGRPGGQRRYSDLAIVGIQTPPAARAGAENRSESRQSGCSEKRMSNLGAR
jgi:hypothetical protein